MQLLRLINIVLTKKRKAVGDFVWEENNAIALRILTGLQYWPEKMMIPTLTLNIFYLCPGIPPNKYQYIDDLVVIVPQNVWEYLYNR